MLDQMTCTSASRSLATHGSWSGEQLNQQCRRGRSRRQPPLLPPEAPDETKCEYGICNPAQGKEGGQPCLHKHILGVQPIHRMQHIASRLTRESPMRRQQARTSVAPGAAPAAADGARRRMVL